MNYIELETLKTFVKDNPNDQDLGQVIREYVRMKVNEKVKTTTYKELECYIPTQTFSMGHG